LSGFSFTGNKIVSMKHDEIEIKLDLINKENYKKLLDWLSQVKQKKPHKQENCFFDTEDWALSKAGWALRIRKEKKIATITAKGPKRDAVDGLTVRPEIEDKISIEQFNIFIVDGIKPAALSPNIKKTISHFYGRQKLNKKISFTNYRTTINREYNGIMQVFEIDRTEYSDGSADYELEVELSNKTQYKTVMNIIGEIFNKAQIPIAYQTGSKYARALRKSGFDLHKPEEIH